MKQDFNLPFDETTTDYKPLSETYFMEKSDIGVDAFISMVGITGIVEGKIKLAIAHLINDFPKVDVIQDLEEAIEEIHKNRKNVIADYSNKISQLK